MPSSASAEAAPKAGAEAGPNAGLTPVDGGGVKNRGSVEVRAATAAASAYLASLFRGVLREVPRPTHHHHSTTQGEAACSATERTAENREQVSPFFLVSPPNLRPNVPPPEPPTINPIQTPQTTHAIQRPLSSVRPLTAETEGWGGGWGGGRRCTVLHGSGHCELHATHHCAPPQRTQRSAPLQTVMP
jgi:hypothetical protein